MCGIHVCIAAPTQDMALSDYMQQQLRVRGPDCYGTKVFETSGEPGSTRVALTAAVLSLRGDAVTHQPIVGEDAQHGDSKSSLCWNGEAWRLGGEEVSGNDGEAVFQALERAESPDGRQAAILSVLRSIEGPFAFAYYDSLGGCLWFGRDRLGRRSLLQRCDTTRVLVLSSVANPEEDGWAEVEADGIYAVDIKRGRVPTEEGIVRYPWPAKEADDASIVRYWWQTFGREFLLTPQILGIGHFNKSTEPPEDQPPLTVESPSVQRLREQLAESLRLRVTNVPEPRRPDGERDTRIAVMFSGGLDCTVLARMAHDLVPAEQGIDLINVAFENPRVKAGLRDGADVYEACPDRMTGRKSLAELQQLCPGRAWRFVPVNVPHSAFVEHRPAVVRLMYPHNTEMDLSIAAALYFAARGGTPARVFLSGLGADELFGGYGRHGIAFARSGYAGLVDELALDVGRLGKRNLGRDDRVTTRWAREVRYPFLDERLVAWALGLPAWEKCDFAHASGGAVEPAKRVLRLLAQSLGMAGAAQEKKRAVQFGARTAKMESGRTKGTTRIS